jgi:hypothetical protein
MSTWHLTKTGPNGGPTRYERTTAFYHKDGDAVEIAVQRVGKRWIADPANELGMSEQFDTAKQAMAHIDSEERAAIMACELGIGAGCEKDGAL